MTSLNVDRKFSFNPLEPPSRGSWWVGVSREEFAQLVKARTKELSVKYGSLPVQTLGDYESGWRGLRRGGADE